MKQETRNPELMVHYLLGELSEEEAVVWVEMEYFGDDAFFQQLLVVENELIDSYVRDELSQRERERFEERFLISPVQRQRVEIARELVDYATKLSAALPAADRETPLNRHAMTDPDLPEDGIDLEAHLAQIEKDYIIRALQRATGNQTRAAAILKMSVRRLRHFLSKHRILSTASLPRELGVDRGIQLHIRSEMPYREHSEDRGIQLHVRSEMPYREHSEARFSISSWWTQGVEFGKELIEYATHRSTQPAAPRGKRVKSSRSLLDMLRARNRAITLAVAAVVLVIAASGSWLIVETLRLRNQVQRIHADRAKALKSEQELKRQLAEQGQHNDQLADDLHLELELLEQELTRRKGSALSTITFILTPDLASGEASEPKGLAIPRGTDFVRIYLDFERGEYKSYRAVLETVDGKRIWSSGSLEARPSQSARDPYSMWINSGKVVMLGLPASLFPKGDYILTLSGVNASGDLEGVGEYYFNVVKK